MRLQYEAGREEKLQLGERLPLHSLPLPDGLRSAAEAVYLRLRPRKKPKCLIHALPVEGGHAAALMVTERVRMHACIMMHACTRTHTLTPARGRKTHTQDRSTYAHVRERARARTHTHTHMHTHIHTHSHTHTFGRKSWMWDHCTLWCDGITVRCGLMASLYAMV